MVSDFRQYRRKHIAELRPYVPGEDLSGVSISAPDKESGSPKIGDMIARNPKNHKNQWLVAEQYFKDNFEPVEAAASVRAEPVAWTGSWSLNALSHGHEGFIYPEETEAHPIPLFTHPAPQPSGKVKALADALRGLLKAYENAFDWTVELPPETVEAERVANEVLYALTADKPHPDDEAVDRFAAAMKAKLKWEREERGRHGWNDPEVCSEKYLARLLIEHLAKGNDGNFEDVANFCMMLHQRGAHPRVLADTLTADKQKQVVTKREIIVAAAISYNGLICTMPQPARHHHILHQSEYSSSEEGFLTSEGRFVDRKKAAELAIKAGQIDQLRWPPYLYSEDLW